MLNANIITFSYWLLLVFCFYQSFCCLVLDIFIHCYSHTFLKCLTTSWQYNLIWSWCLFLDQKNNLYVNIELQYIHLLNWVLKLPDVPASGMYFMSYEWLKNLLTPAGKRWMLVLPQTIYTCLVLICDLLNLLSSSAATMSSAFPVCCLLEEWLVSATGQSPFHLMFSSLVSRQVSF